MANNEVKKNDCIRMMSRKERYLNFHKEVNEIKEELRTANVQESVEEIISRLETMIEDFVKDNQLDDIHGFLIEIVGTIRSVRMHDFTRLDLIRLLEQMLERVDEILAGEKAKENAEKVRLFFHQCAENAEDIAKLVDFNKILN